MAARYRTLNEVIAANIVAVVVDTMVLRRVLHNVLSKAVLMTAARNTHLLL